MEDTNLYINLTEEQEDALSDLELAADTLIQACIDAGCKAIDILDTLNTVRNKHESELGRLAYRQRLQEHNKRIKDLNSVVGVKEA